MTKKSVFCAICAGALLFGAGYALAQRDGRKGWTPGTGCGWVW